MARGSPLRASESAAYYRRAIDMMYQDLTKTQTETAIKTLADDDDARSAFQRMLGFLKTQVSSSHAGKEKNKENKLNLVKSFESLPESLKKLMTLPPESARTLWRGIRENRVPKPDPLVSGWQNGGYAYSFSASEDVAKGFSKSAMGGGSTINASDKIESLKGIINLPRIIEVAEAYNNSRLSDGQEMTFNQRDWPTDWQGEHEVLVYGIKFKPDAFK